MITPPSPERTRREGVEVAPVRLADGQAWGLALPSLRWKPEVVERIDPLGRPTRSIRLVPGSDYPLEIRRLVAELRSACKRGRPRRRYEAFIALASALVRRAHDIDRSEAIALLELEDQELPGLVEAVLAVVSEASPPDPPASRKGEVDG
jgi:hypothetical protein